jgi:hypothetical protein
MPTKPIDRLLFAQGGNCFFCRRALPKDEASIEHLVAQTNGGGNDDENCVACCKTLNRLLGRMSLKEKLQVVLNQKGAFSCPGALREAVSQSNLEGPIVVRSKSPLSRDEQVDLIVLDLQKRGNAKPGSREKLLNTIRSALTGKDSPPSDAELVLQQLEVRGLVTLLEGKVSSYQLPTR